MSFPELPESQPVWKSAFDVQPLWSSLKTVGATWTRFPNITGTPAYDEVGYGEGGYGEGGYDTPSIAAVDVPTPIWTVEDIK